MRLMKMESTRRSFDRSRELQQQLGLKKPRLANAEEPSLPSSNDRPYASRQAAALARLRAASDRDSESNSSSMSGGGGYQPQQPHLYQELMSQYKTALAELTFNSKPIITNLTIIAGENLHAAKAIAATICANIIEVPSEQKLPSLYLLDSIVKNIGRDYIKYFAARLPEVFCKAYKQVDSTVHQSMRHLFGTWKGVFPPQSLQLIGRELGFTSAVNGSSSGGTTSKPDSQSQRPPHSIHVNPKYLERQHLHQAKGVVDDIIVPTASSTKDVEKSGRAATTGAGRTWVDPAVKIPNIQRSHREVLAEPVHEKKKIGALYGDFEYGADVVRTSGFGTGRTGGRVSERGHDKNRLETGRAVTETISGQRNGYNVKHGFQNYSASKSNDLDFHLQLTQSSVRSSPGMSTSWKNSEEEEFMWEMHSRVSEQDVAIRSTESRKDCWTPDDSDKLELENIPQKPSTAHAVGSRFDRDTSSESTELKETSTFGHNLSSQWRSQESPSNDFLSEMDCYSATTGGLLTNTSSLPKMAGRPHSASSHVGIAGIESFTKASLGSTPGILGKQRFQALGAASPSEQSPKRQDSPSPPSAVLLPHQQFQSSTEQDYRQSQLLLRPDNKAPQVPGKLLPQQHNLQKLLPEDQKAKEVELSSLKPPIPLASGIKAPTLGSSAENHSDLLSEETPGHSSTRSLLAAVMKSGILSNITSGGLPKQSLQDVCQMASQPSIQHSLPSRLPPTHFSSSRPIITAVSSSSSLSDDISKTAADISQKKEEQPPLPPGPALSSSQIPSSVSKDSNPLSNLLSTLVAKGLISASKSEKPSVLPKQMDNQLQTQKQDAATHSSSAISAVPLPSTVDGKSISKPDAKTSVSLPVLPKQMDNQLLTRKQDAATRSSSVISAVPVPSTVGGKSISKPDTKTSVGLPVLPKQMDNQLQTQIQDASTHRSSVISAVPLPSTVDGKSISKPDSKTSVALPEPEKVEIDNLIGLAFKSEIIRELHPHVISALFDDLPHQCSMCGLKLKYKERLDRHLHWHALKSERDGISVATRRWYTDLANWVNGEAGVLSECGSSSLKDEFGKMIDEDEQMIPADENQCVCVLCGELFEDYYSPGRNGWMFKGAVHMSISSQDGEMAKANESAKGPIVHSNCMMDNSFHEASGVEMKKDA